MVHASPSGPSDALVRAWRTFGQGGVVAVLVGVGAVLTALDTTPDWRTIGLSCIQAVATAVVTYIHNKTSPPQQGG